MTGGVHTSITEELKSGKTVTYFTVGVSMRPLLTERKTHVMIAPPGKVKNGDVLLYVRKNGALVLHRLIKQDESSYYMRGDNTYGLECIEKAQALGVMTYIYRKGKTFDVKNKAYRAYVVLWRALYPCRWLLFKAKAIFRRLLK